MEALQADKILEMSKASVAQINAVSRGSPTESATASCECMVTIDTITKQLK